MFSFIKEVFGKDGIKMKIATAPAYPKNIKTLNGDLEFSVQKDKTIQVVQLQLVERYTRGRGQERKTDEHLLGTWALPQPLSLKAGNVQTIRFELPFEFLYSKMEELAEQGNLVQKGLAKLAQGLKGVSSTYYLEARAKVEGTKLDLIDKVEITFFEGDGVV